MRSLIILLFVMLPGVLMAQHTTDRNSDCGIFKNLNHKKITDTLILQVTYTELNMLPQYPYHPKEPMQVISSHYRSAISFTLKNCVRVFSAAFDSPSNEINSMKPGSIAYLKCVVYENYHEKDGTPFFVVIDARKKPIKLK